MLANYVDGEFVTTERRFDKLSPVDGSRVAVVCEADRALVDRAVAAARRAIRGDWGRLAMAERAALLHKVADGIERRFDEFVAAEVDDTGKPAAQARTLDIPRGAANFRIFADLVRNVPTESFHTDTADGGGCAELRRATSTGRHRRHRAVESAVAVDDLESGARACGRQCSRCEALRGNALERLAPGGSNPRGRAATRVRSTCCTVTAPTRPGSS